MRILVTGAFGYLGLAIVRRLANDHDMVAFGHPPRVAGAIAAVPANVVTLFGDILDVRRTLAGEAGFDAVIHLAGGGGPHRCEADPTAAVETNVRGTLELYDATRGARTVYASSIAIYGNRRAGQAYRETDGEAPDDLYGAVKAAADRITTANGGIALRIANIYGAGSGVDLGIQGAAERFARAAASSGELTVYGTGAQQIDYVHVDDVAHAVELAVRTGIPAGPLNVGGGQPVSIGALARQCVAAGEALGTRPTLVTKPAPEGKIWPDRSLAIDQAARVLGWRPTRNLSAGIDELVLMMRRTVS